VTTLELGNPPLLTVKVGSSSPPTPKLTSTPLEPVARPVLLWVGMSDPVLASMRDRLPSATRALLNCCDEGFKHTFPTADGSFEVRRIRYGNKALGYGIIVAQWQTIATKSTIPDYMNDKLSMARLILQRLGLVPRVHLIDRAPA
jgi:hypothetical protein